ncbi:hypothetical protein OIU85_004003 [Salix viminalis]|uniref:Pectate lyase n=1 Tax=Salix viminalis TaxID=40686 RepID=A0A9Q0PSD4_SALVM|nr:hypothetical protein OIU85_004003 [Salix viminalis]
MVTPCLAFSLALSLTGNVFHFCFHAQDTTSPAVSVNPFPWLTTKPSDSVRSITASGGGAPAVIMCTGFLRGSTSGDLEYANISRVEACVDVVGDGTSHGHGKVKLVRGRDVGGQNGDHVAHLDAVGWK